MCNLDSDWYLAMDLRQNFILLNLKVRPSLLSFLKSTKYSHLKDWAMKLEFIVHSNKTHKEECTGCIPLSPCVLSNITCAHECFIHTFMCIHMHTNMHIFVHMYAHVQILLSIKDLVEMGPNIKSVPQKSLLRLSQKLN